MGTGLPPDQGFIVQCFSHKHTNGTTSPRRLQGKYSNVLSVREYMTVFAISDGQTYFTARNNSYMEWMQAIVPGVGCGD